MSVKIRILFTNIRILVTKVSKINHFCLNCFMSLELDTVIFQNLPWNYESFLKNQLPYQNRFLTTWHQELFLYKTTNN